MLVLTLGLALFLGIHSTRVFADDWRGAQIERLGRNTWMASYSLVSIAGLGIALWGYGMTRGEPVFIWYPPLWTHTVVALLMIPAFILLAATYSPPNHIRSTFKHPMLLGVIIWSFAHLLANGRLGDVLLFGAFLAWAFITLRAACQRDGDADAAPPNATLTGDAITIGAGLIGYVLFALYLHEWVAGVPAFR